MRACRGPAISGDVGLQPSGSSVGRLITLPNRSPEWLSPDEVEPARVAGQHAFPDALTVLLVEDDPGDAHLVGYALKSERAPSFKVLHVETLAEAVAGLKENPEIGVVLLDLSLPDSFGLETVTRMQAEAPRLPIVIMTGHDDPEFAAKALETGAQDYLVKNDASSRTISRAIRYAITRKSAELERQSLAERVVAQQRILMQEVSAARAMQFDLLPRAERLAAPLGRMGLEIEAYFEPSSGIGGDLWGCMEAGPDRMCCYAFDFSGHGIGAALNVFRLHALIAEHWRPGLAPSEVLQTLGRALNGLLRRSQFATMLLGVIDCGRNELSWASAGSPPPVLVSQGQPRFLDSRGVPLGLQATPAYRTQTVPFLPGDSLLLYSDAITDAEVGGDSFGEAGLEDLVRRLLAEQGEMTVSGLLDLFHAVAPPPNIDDLTAVRFSRLRG
ncbi:phosphoserine phosphatase RsbP [mine drainage metagenome]|uniref:Phosphoserine phosphatase RsbP n=1 Tax=mine drainage metagenome TaxID=410659 RepID=A0A1J5RFA7_9ZZZZ